MERTRRTRALLAAAAALAAPLLAGCGAGIEATAVKPYSPGDGTLTNAGDLRIANALVVAAPSSTGGVVSAAIVNRGSSRDRLTGVTSPDGTVVLTGPGTVPAGGSLTLGADSPTHATMSSLTSLPGESITLRLTFAKAGPVRVRTVVVPSTGFYSSVTPSASPSAG